MAELSKLGRLARVMYTHDARGRIVQVNEDDGPAAPAVFVAWGASELLWRVRHDVELQIEPIVVGHRPGGFLQAPAWAAALREALAPIADEHAAIEYEFPDELPALGDTVDATADNIGILERWLPSWKYYARLGLPMKAVLVDGDAVSVCACVRRPDDGATAAGLETHAPFRGQGHAAIVTAAWARAVRAHGLVPLYGTSWSNTASQGVAAKLGLRAYAGSIAIEAAGASARSGG